MPEVDNIEDASHRLCAAFHAEGIDPADVEVLLPLESWWRFYCRLAASSQRDLAVFDGRGELPAVFRYMGVAYISKGPRQ
jgi:hypothetical protein